MWFTHARTYQDNHTHITFNSHLRYLIEETKQLSNFLSQEISLNLPHFARMHHKGYASYNLSICFWIKKLHLLSFMYSGIAGCKYY